MLMPGRAGYSVTGGWATSSGSSSSPANLSISSRSGNAPSEYVASESIEFTPSFESGNGDAFDAYLGSIVSTGGSGSTGSGYASGGYRYGFNGKDRDDEDGVIQYDYGFRVYDPRIGRFKSVDPLAKNYPFYTPYQFAANMPIAAIDLDGAEAKVKLNWGTVTKDRTAIEISADINIKVQVINLSSTSSYKMDLEQVASNLKSDLEDKLSGQHTTTWNLPFVFKSKGNTITDVEMAKASKDFKNTSITYSTSVSAQVSVVDDMSQIDNNTWVFAIVDKVKTSDGKDWGGMAYGIGAGKVAIGTAESFLPKNLETHGRNTAFHEIAHLLGAKDTYPPNTEIYPDTQRPDNLMYSGSGLNLTPDQIIKEIWQATIGTIQKVFKEGVKDYKQPSDPSYSQPTQDQLKQHIQNYGAKN
jgi:RHS repeat-associated protein